MLIQTVGCICAKIHWQRNLSNSFGAYLSMQEVHVEIESRSNETLKCDLFMDTTFRSKPAWSLTRTLTLQQVIFPSFHSPLPHLQAMPASVLIIHSEAQPPESARWHRQQHVYALEGRRIR
jgi:hypothetical protein